MQALSLAAMIAQRQEAARARAAEVAANRELARFCRDSGVCMNRVQWDSPEYRTNAND